MKLVVTAALIAVALPGVATAQDAKPKKEKQVCRQTSPTGSRFKSRECHTEAEWAEIDAANKSSADSNGRGSPPPVRR